MFISNLKSSQMSELFTFGQMRRAIDKTVVSGIENTRFLFTIIYL